MNIFIYEMHIFIYFIYIIIYILLFHLIQLNICVISHLNILNNNREKKINIKYISLLFLNKVI